MQIVVTDGYTLNPGDLNWDRLRALGDVNIHDRTSPEELVERCLNAEIIITNKTPVDAAAINALDKLKMISVTATGYNVIDVKAAAAKNIPVSNVPGYGTASVAQHTVALLLELSNGAGNHSEDVNNGGWQKSVDWCYTVQPVTELSDKTFGIIGMGNIGRQVAAIVSALGMKVIYHTPNPKKEYPGEYMQLEEVFAAADVVSLHCPQTPENTGFVNAALLSSMKKTAWLINTSRGGLINENDLAAALTNGTIKLAALDVLSKEPPLPNHPLIGLPNCIVTPHIAWISKEARQRIMAQTVQNVESFINGKAVNVVNQTTG
jgi:glycerate dehydrogenase